MLAFPPGSLTELEPGSHVAVLFDDAEQQIAATAPFLMEGLDRKEFCAYFADAPTSALAMRRLAASGIDVDHHRDRGALALVTEPPDGLLADGRFEPQAMVAFLRRSIDQALEAGFNGFRAAGDATIALGPEPDFSLVAEYEACLDEAFPDLRGARGICGYDMRRVPPDVIRDMLRTHSAVVVGDKLCTTNLYYEPPSALLGPYSESERVAWMLTQLTRLRATELERASLHQDLADREQRLEELLRRLVQAQEDERRRVAYDIHDGLAQVASAAQQHLEEFASRCPPCPDEDRRLLERVRELAQRAVVESRRIIAGLRPLTLDDLGLAAAVRAESDEFQAAGFDITFTENLGPKRLPSRLETAFFRVAQEALTNVRKHAHSKRVAVDLTRTGARLCLEVRDWGVGFESHDEDRVSRRTGVGLMSMQERIALLGGEFSLNSHTGVGTTIRAEVELPVS